MIRLELDDRELKRALDTLSARVSNMTPVMHRIAQVMDEGTRQHFEAERGPDGQKWKPLAESTLLAHMRRASPGGLLTKRGNTRAKAVSALAQKKILRERGDLGHELIKEATSMSAILGSNKTYSNTHQFGRGNIPARPFLGFSDAIKASIMDAVADYIAEV